MSEDVFFKQLLDRTKQVFKITDVYKKQQGLKQNWNYSVCGTPIQKNKGILLGINWGADDNHEPQSDMPEGKDILEYRFINRSKKYLENYLKLDFNSINFNYTNLCFFRTKAEKDLSDDDYKSSLPLFKSFVEFINPPWIFSLGTGNYYRLQQFGELKNIKEFPDSENKFKGVTATLWGHKFYAVPHPNAHVKGASRDEIWKLIGKNIR